MTTIGKPTNFAEATLVAAQADRAAGKARRRTEHAVRRANISIAHLEQDIVSEMKKQEARMEMASAVVEGVGYVVSAGTDIADAQKQIEAEDATETVADAAAETAEEVDAKVEASTEEVVDDSKDTNGEKNKVKLFQQIFEKAFGVFEENHARNVETELEDAGEAASKAREQAGRMDAMINDEQGSIDALLEVRRKVFALNGAGDGEG